MKSPSFIMKSLCIRFLLLGLFNCGGNFLVKEESSTTDEGVTTETTATGDTFSTPDSNMTQGDANSDPGPQTQTPTVPVVKLVNQKDVSYSIQLVEESVATLSDPLMAIQTGLDAKQLIDRLLKNFSFTCIDVQATQTEFKNCQVDMGKSSLLVNGKIIFAGIEVQLDVLKTDKNGLTSAIKINATLINQKLQGIIEYTSLMNQVAKSNVIKLDQVTFVNQSTTCAMTDPQTGAITTMNLPLQVTSGTLTQTMTTTDNSVTPPLITETTGTLMFNGSCDITLNGILLN